MIFQPLDEKNMCTGIYADGKILKIYNEGELEATWNYNPLLRGLPIKYASLYAAGKSLEECCPLELRARLMSVNKRLKSFLTSFMEAKVSLKENCVNDLLPETFVKEMCDIKVQITKHVLETHPEPKEYAFYRRFSELLHEISTHDLNLDFQFLADKLYDPAAKRLWDKSRTRKRIYYNMFGSVTGRLTVSENSFPVLTLHKKYRQLIKPQNDWIVELDLNAAELRVAQALLNKEQVEGDYHEWCAKNIMRGEVSRSEAKTAATQWLYNSKSALATRFDKELTEFYKKDALLAMYWVGGMVHTPFGRQMPCDEHHAISYLNQSTLIDLFHRQIIKADDYLMSKKSFISLLLHDSVVLDLADSEKKILPDIIREISDTKYGKFPVGVKIGRNYGDLKKVEIKL